MRNKIGLTLTCWWMPGFKFILLGIRHVILLRWKLPKRTKSCVDGDKWQVRRIRVKVKRAQ